MFEKFSNFNKYLMSAKKKQQRTELLVTKNSIVSRVRWLLYMLQAVIFQDRTEMFVWLGRRRIKTTYDSDATITKKQNHLSSSAKIC